MNRRSVCFALITLVAAGAVAARNDVPDGSVTVKVGQELFVSFTTNGDTLVTPRMLPGGNGPDPVVTIQVTQSGPTRTLLITNGYTRSLAYRVMARKRGSRKEIEIPTAAVRSGMQSVVSMAEPFDELVLFEFHLQG